MQPEAPCGDARNVPSRWTLLYRGMDGPKTFPNTLARLGLPANRHTVSMDTVVSSAALGKLDGPVRNLFEQIAPYGDLTSPDLPRIARELAALAADHDYLAPAIGAWGDRTGTTPLHVPPRGPRLFLVHRRHGEMSAVHDHHVWVALAPIIGVETHRRWRRLTPHDHGHIELWEDGTVEAGHCVTMQPPDDIHDHGHRLGVGKAAYLLILLGDDQVRYRRHEWDPVSGRRRTLEPGDRGRWLASQPFPGRLPA